MIDNAISISKVENRSGVLAFFLKTIIMFLYIFEFSFDAWGFPSFVTSRRVAILIVLLYLIIHSVFHGGVFRIGLPNCYSSFKLKRFLYFNLFLLLYTTVLYVFIGGTGELALEGIIRLILFGLFPILLFYMLFKDVDELMNAVLLAIVIQSIIICICLASPSFSEMIDKIFVSPGSDYVLTHRSEYAGGIACVTAPGLLKFSMGIVACLYKVLSTKKQWYMLLYFFLAIVGTLIARTGLFVSLAGIAVMMWYFIKEQKSIHLVKFIIGILLVCGLIVLIINYFDLWELLAFRLRRFSKLSNGIAQGFMVGYFHGENNSYPPLSIKTIIGTGIVSGISNNGVNINADGGFYRLYAAFGLPLCIVFYISFFVNSVKIANRSVNNAIKFTLLFFVLVFAIGEFKEYTIYMQYMVCIFYTISLLARKDDKREGLNESL